MLIVTNLKNKQAKRYKLEKIMMKYYKFQKKWEDQIFLILKFWQTF